MRQKLAAPRRENLNASSKRRTLSPSAVVAAVQAYAKINSAGERIDRTETVVMNDLFKRMTTPELEAYTKHGSLPEWFRATVGSAQ